MLTLLDFQERALNGPVIKERDFDLRFSRKVRQLVADFEIVFDREKIIPDPAMADAVFKAGVTLLVENGIFHMETGRLIELSKDEVAEVIVTRGKEVTLGEGEDAFVLRARRPEDRFAPVTVMGPGCEVTEELFDPIVRSFAQEETAQGIMHPSVKTIGGTRNAAGQPAEVLHCVTPIKWVRRIAREVGKPGAWHGPVAGITPAAMLTGFSPEGYTKHNCHLPVHIWPELKLGWDRFVLAAYAREHGIVPWVSYVPLIGAYCRNAAEASITIIAAILGELAYSDGHCGSAAPRSIKGGNSSNRQSLQGYAASGLAIERNLPIAWGGNMTGPLAGPCTEMVLYEIAAMTMVQLAIGCEWLWGTAGRVGAVSLYASGMEGRMFGELARGAAGIHGEEANAVILALLDKYEDKLANGTAPPGKPFHECYDVEHVTPTREYLDIYARAQRNLRELGVTYGN